MLFEVLQGDGVAGHDVPVPLQAKIAGALEALLAPGGPIRDVHNVHVRRTTRGLVVNFHCHADTRLAVDAVHRAVDELERRLLEQHPDLQRAIGHAEPQ